MGTRPPPHRLYSGGALTASDPANTATRAKRARATVQKLRGRGGIGMPRVVAEEQGVGDILHGSAFRGCNPLYQVGERPGEVYHKIFEPLGTPKRSYSGDYLAYSVVAALRRHAPRISQLRTPTSNGSQQRRRSAVVKCSSPRRQDISTVRGTTALVYVG